MAFSDLMLTFSSKPISSTNELMKMSAANKYCKEKNKEAVFTQEGTKYTGTMDESTRKTVQKASKAAMVLGGIGGVVSRESAVPGAVLGGAGTVGTIMTSDRDYESTATFKCQ
jgi:hypothetical protein